MPQDITESPSPEASDARDLVREVDAAVRGDRDEYRAHPGAGWVAVEVEQYDAEGNVVASWALSAGAAAHLVDSGDLSGFEFSYAVYKAERATGRKAAA